MTPLPIFVGADHPACRARRPTTVCAGEYRGATAASERPAAGSPAAAILPRTAGRAAQSRDVLRAMHAAIHPSRGEPASEHGRSSPSDAPESPAQIVAAASHDSPVPGSIAAPRSSLARPAPRVIADVSDARLSASTPDLSGRRGGSPSTFHPVFLRKKAAPNSLGGACLARRGGKRASPPPAP
jgi:hypothetical protein